MLEIVRLVSFLVRVSRHLESARRQLVGSAVTGLASGVGYMSLVAVLSSALRPDPSRRLLAGFIALCVLVPSARLASQALLNALGTDAVFALRLDLARKIIATPLRTLERLGSHRLLASLSDDVAAISAAVVLVPVLFMHVAIIAASVVYMGWLSGRLLLVVLAFMAGGLLTYGLPLRRALAYVRRMRQELDTLYGHFRGLIYGAKELKLHRRRRRAFLSSALAPSADLLRRCGFRGQTIFTAAAVWGNLLFFVVIGLVVFYFAGRWHLAGPVLAGYALSLLYIATPLETISTSLPVLGRAAAAVAKLEQLGLELGTVPVAPMAEDAEVGAAAAGWQRLELRDVTYTYGPATNQADHFTTGPINLVLRRGEVVFLTGANGSGKSTLAKVLAGLYVPDAGEIRVDGTRISDANRDEYRQLFSAIFADFYVFQTLLGLDDAAVASEGARYLAYLDLAAKVEIRNGELSTVDLSYGQRKRLGLLVALLENRPIYLFDEWAADQDPHYRATFYNEILPALKARGKTVFVISHDEQYYGAADRLIKMNYGQVECDRYAAEQAAATQPAHAGAGGAGLAAGAPRAQLGSAAR